MAGDHTYISNINIVIVDFDNLGFFFLLLNYCVVLFYFFYQCQFQNVDVHFWGVRIS